MAQATLRKHTPGRPQLKGGTTDYNPPKLTIITIRHEYMILTSNSTIQSMHKTFLLDLIIRNFFQNLAIVHLRCLETM